MTAAGKRNLERLRERALRRREEKLKEERGEEAEKGNPFDDLNRKDKRSLLRIVPREIKLKERKEKNLLTPRRSTHVNRKIAKRTESVQKQVRREARREGKR